MAKIISFISEKGGVGKTTAVYHCAGGLQRFHEKKVLVVDADYQRGGLTCRLRPELLEHFRCAKQSLVLLAGCKSRSGGGSGRSLVRANHPPVLSVAPLTDSVANGRDTVANVNNRGEAYTENLVGQRGVRTTLKRNEPR